MRIRKRAILVVLAVVFVLFVANAVEGNLLNRAGAALKEENYPLALERIKPLAMLGDSTAQQNAAEAIARLLDQPEEAAAY